MLDLPLHPLVVHLPIALSVLLPLVSLSALLLFWRETPNWKQWAVVPMLSAVLVGSAWAALETGEQDEEIVESVVAESAIEAHEEAAELFMFGVGALLLVSLGGLAPRNGIRKAAGIATVVTSLGVLGLGVNVGHKGGQLVYEHGAASAHANNGDGAASAVGYADDD